MKTISGKPVVGAIAHGTIVFYQRNDLIISRRKVSDTTRELNRYEKAKSETEQELDSFYEDALERLGEENAQIFIIHKMMLMDNQFDSRIQSLITDSSYNAEYAVARAAIELTRVLANNDSDYVRERTADVRDISERLIRHLLNAQTGEIELKENSIICADSIMPSEAMMFDKTKIAAFCTASGAENSHASILARSMDLPCIVCMGDELCDDLDGKEAIVDGYEGLLYVEPDEITIRRAQDRIKVEQRKHEMLTKLIGEPNKTIDGRSVKVCASVYDLSEVESAVSNDAEGIGLFRSESLYVGERVFPDEELLFYNYRRVLEDMNGKEVTLLTYDMSAEKTADILNMKKEPNPALGYRSIRVCLEQQEIFKTQIRAMLRASVYGKMSLILPLIIDIGEFRHARAIINDVKEQLREEGTAFSEDVKIGVMIETPAAVMTSDLLAKDADFFCIGTNDLEQFTLALDKNNSKYDRIRPENSTALLRMIKLVCDNAHKNGIEVGVCGEMASDLSMTEILLQMNVDMLSVIPSRVLSLRKVIRELDLSDQSRTENLLSQCLQTQ